MGDLVPLVVNHLVWNREWLQAWLCCSLSFSPSLSLPLSVACCVFNPTLVPHVCPILCEAFICEPLSYCNAKDMLYSFDDDSDQCMEESPRVLAFFDHLIQHEKDEDTDGKDWQPSAYRAPLAWGVIAYLVTHQLFSLKMQSNCDQFIMKEL